MDEPSNMTLSLTDDEGRTLKELLNSLRLLSESAEELPEIMKLLQEYHRSGTLRRALEIMTLLSVIIDSIGTETIVRFAKAANSAILSADRLLSHVQLPVAAATIAEAARKAEQDNRSLGVTGLLRALKEPSVQKALKFLLHFAAIVDQRGSKIRK